ncbi:MAG: monovalent cation/H(+) antiporter subunit G [Arenicellales bacterium WSBS_2016_MAG_OTU3]
MLTHIATILSALCLLIGSFFVVCGGIGALRFPDFFSRLHAGSITDSLGGGLILLGLIFLAGASLVSVKLLLIIAVVGLTSPTASHALAKAALHGKLIPIGAPNDIPLVGNEARTPNLSNIPQASFDTASKQQAATTPVFDGEVLTHENSGSKDHVD